MRSAGRARVVVLALCALFSGAALLAAVLLRLSLGVTLAICGAFGLAFAAAIVRTLPLGARAELARRAIGGAAGGIAGVALYDAVRFTLVGALHLHVRPFEALPLFGALIAGVAPHSPASWVVGTLYHYLNGVMFGVSYGVALGRRSWLWAIPWALGLEALMLLLYPGWLHIGPAVLEEFTIVSLSGHLAYGCGLGLTTAAVVRRSERASF
jgi:hypothetical protein